MDKFPDDLNLASCKQVIESKQIELLRNTRKKFYEEIKSKVDTCEKTIVLIFPNNLFHKYRIQILSELLKLFGELKIKATKNNIIVTRLTEDIENITAVNEIILEFFEN